MTFVARLRFVHNPQWRLLEEWQMVPSTLSGATQQPSLTFASATTTTRDLLEQRCATRTERWHSTLHQLFLPDSPSVENGGLPLYEIPNLVVQLNTRTFLQWHLWAHYIFRNKVAGQSGPTEDTDISMGTQNASVDIATLASADIGRITHSSWLTQTSSRTKIQSWFF